MPFSDCLSGILKQADAIGTSTPAEARVVRALLEQAAGGLSLDQEEIVELVNGTRDSRNSRMVMDFAAGLSRPRDREILLLPPLYFSSICENNCRYRNFSSK